MAGSWRRLSPKRGPIEDYHGSSAFLLKLEGEQKKERVGRGQHFGGIDSKSAGRNLHFVD